MKSLILFLVGIAIGAFIMTLTKNDKINPTGQNSISKKWAEHGISHIQRLIEKNQLTPEEQLKAAEEYYGKAVILFLATIVKRHQTTPLQAESTQEASLETVDSDVKAMNGDEKSQSLGISAKESSLSATLEEEKKILSEDKNLALDRFIAFRKSPLIKKLDPLLQKIQGRYEGHLQHKAPKEGRIDHVILDIQLENSNKDVRGEIVILLSKPDGTQYSRSVNSGANNKIRKVMNHPSLIYLEPIPGEFFVLDITYPHQLRGKYYDGEGRYKGEVQVSKI